MPLCDRFVELRPGTGREPWQSRGGPAKSPWRTLPRSFAVRVPEFEGAAARLELEGAFCLGIEEGVEGGKPLAVVSLHERQGTLWSLALTAGRHASDARDLARVLRANGDGTWVETVGVFEAGGRECRWDRLSIELPGGLVPTEVRFAVLHDQASFVVGSVALGIVEERRCPFHSASDSVSLAEIGMVLRTGNAARFQEALDQLAVAVEAVPDDDEARSLALTFVAVVGSAMLELGGPRRFHSVQLEAARRLIAAQSRAEVAALARSFASELASSALPAGGKDVPVPVAAALALLERKYATQVTELEAARAAGLSVSHFRHVFRQAMGEPFHRYLVGLRLEAGRRMLSRPGAGVAEVALAVGFSTASHFSRLFSRRFGFSPSSLRKSAGEVQTRQDSHSMP